MSIGTGGVAAGASGNASAASSQSTPNSSTQTQGSTQTSNVQGSTQNTNPGSGSKANKPPAPHTALPLPGSKQAPEKYKGGYRSLGRFLRTYEHLCAQYNVTESDQKCLGIVVYVSDDVADLLENLPSFIAKNYPALLTAMKWLFDESRQKTQYHNGHLEAITNKWCDKPIRNLETFKKYQLKFTKIAGGLQQQGQLSSQEMDRRFWDGICDEARDRLERRMLDINPRLNTAIPYTVDEIAAAAEHIYDRNRFDKHLRERAPTTRFSTPPSRRRKGKKKAEDSDTSSESESESEESEEEPAPREKNRSKEKSTIAPSGRREVLKRNTPVDEITELVNQMENLNISPTTYRTLFVRLSLLAPEVSKYYRAPFSSNAGSYLNQDARQPPKRMQRDPPPHQAMTHQVMMSQDARVGERREFTCFGCGDRGHRMDQCEKIEAFIGQGHVKRLFGKLRWADGSNIFKEPEESWTQAIGRRLQQKNMERPQEKGMGGRSVYFVEVEREDSDAGTDDQEELGWTTGSTLVPDVQSYNVDRVPRVSRESRKKSTNDVLPGSHRVKEFTERRHRDVKGVGKKPILKDRHQDRDQHWLQGTPAPTPIDVAKNEFEGETDKEFVPMDVEEFGVEQRINNRGKASTRDLQRPLRNTVQGRPRKGKTQSEVVDQIMQMELTLPLKDIALISPIVRRDLAGTLKAMRDDAPDEPCKSPEAEKGAKPPSLEPEGIKIMRAKRSNEGMRELVMESQERREARKDLLKLKSTVGEARMMGVVDSGSMVSMISAEKLEISGLPSKPLGEKSFKVTGMNGGSGYCRSWVEKAKIYVTPSGLETTSDLYVLDNADFDLLLGRPWMTFNAVNIMERARGTYVSWISGDTRYEINVSRARRTRVPPTVEVRSETDGSEDDRERAQTVATYAVKSVPRTGTDRSYIPPSTVSQEGPDYLDKPEESDGEQESVKAERCDAQDRVSNWRAKGRESKWNKEEADDERESEEEVVDDSELEEERIKEQVPAPSQCESK